MISRKFSISAHVAELLTNCARTLFALRTLKQHGLPPEAVHTVFQAIVMAKINYASPAWWGFTSADDRGRLEAFYRRYARVSATATTIQPLPACLMKMTNDFSTK